MAKNQEKSIDINDEYQGRLAKLDRLRAEGVEAYPARTKKDTRVVDFLDNFDKLLKSQKSITTAGRIVAMRVQGGSSFFNIEDYSGRVQIFFRKDQVGEDKYKIFKEDIDIGDFIEITGKAFATKTKEPTILADDFTFLSKALLPLPDQYYGLKDPDLRFRKRYLDLLVNPKVKDTFRLRSEVIKLTRQFFDEHEFVEVDTPVLQSVAGGATAQPFITHHNALDIDMYLRVAPELYLKRLIIGGYDRVYEMARCFRNEGIDHQHNPEFTQIEAYWAYRDYKFLMDFMEDYFEFLVKSVNGGKTKIKNSDDTIDFKGPYPRIDFKEALDKALKIDLDKTDDKQLFKLAKDAKLDPDKSWGRGKLLDELYKKFVRSKIIQPTFIINHPLELSPLAKKMPDRPDYVERFQLVVKTAELCNAFSELNDPLDQEERFIEQKKLREAGDQEAQGADADFVEALKHGMPPTVGLGVGIDRLVMMLGDIENIKEVILFPTMRPKNEDK